MTTKNIKKILSNHNFFVVVMKNDNKTELLRILNKRLERILKKEAVDDRTSL